MLSNGSTWPCSHPDATVSWLCHPRPDSAAIFADVLGGAAGRTFLGRSRSTGLPLGQRYRPGHDDRRDPLVRESPSPTGSRAPSDRTASVASSLERMLDLVRVLTGEAAARLEFAPRPEFGQVPIRLQPLGDGLLVLGSNEPIALYTPGVEWDVFDDGGHDTARAVVDLAASGGRRGVELRFDSRAQPASGPLSRTGRPRAEQSWRDWAAGLQLPATATAR